VLSATRDMTRSRRRSLALTWDDPAAREARPGGFVLDPVPGGEDLLEGRVPGGPEETSASHAAMAHRITPGVVASRTAWRPGESGCQRFSGAPPHADEPDARAREGA
jgi:hypothetical protein